MSEPVHFFSTAGYYIKKWNDGSHKLLYEIKPGGHVYRIALTSDSTIMVVATDTCFITLDANTGKRLQTFETFESCYFHVRSVAISPDDLTVVSDGNEHTVKVWDICTAELRMTLKGHEDCVLSVAISPTGEKIASGSKDNTVCVWSMLGVDAGKLLFRLRGHTDWVRSLIFIHGTAGQHIISGSDDPYIRVWNVDDGANMSIIYVRSCVYSLAVNSSGDRLVCGCIDNSVRVYGLKGPYIKQLILRMNNGHANTVFTVTITPDEQHIISGSVDESMIKWKIESGEKLHTFAGQTGNVRNIVCCLPTLFFDHGVELNVSGRVIVTNPNRVLCNVGSKTRVEINDDRVFLYEYKTTVGKIIASDSSKALEWKDWILAVQNNLMLPKEERLKTGSRIMARYKSDWFQVANIKESAKVDFLPKNAMNLIIHYIYK